MSTIGKGWRRLVLTSYVSFDLEKKILYINATAISLPFLLVHLLPLNGAYLSPQQYTHIPVRKGTLQDLTKGRAAGGCDRWGTAR